MCRSKHVEQLRNSGIINSTTRSHRVGYFYKIYSYQFFVSVCDSGRRRRWVNNKGQRKEKEEFNNFVILYCPMFKITVSAGLSTATRLEAVLASED